MRFDPMSYIKNDENNMSDDIFNQMGGEEPDRVEHALNDYTEKLLNYHAFENRQASRSAF